MDIGPWGYDAQISNYLKSKLSARFTFKDLTYDPQSLALLPHGPLDNPRRELKKRLAKIPHDGIDAFIVVRPELPSGVPGTQGLGYKGGGGFPDYPPTEWANYEIDIVDANTMDTIAKSPSMLQVRKDGPMNYPGIYRPDSMRFNADLAPTEAQYQQLRKDLTMLLSGTMLTALRAMNLGVPLPEPGQRQLVPIPPEQRTKLKSVAIVSAIGDTLDLEHIGGTILSTSREKAPIADWNLDARVEADVATALEKDITVKSVPADRATLAAAVATMDDDYFKKPLAGLTPSNDIDAYVLVLKRTGPINFFNRDGTGVGLWNKSLIASGTAVFAHYAIVLVDPHSLKPQVIYAAAASPAQSTAEPFRKVDDSLWAENAAALTGDRASAVRAKVEAVVDDSVAETILRMGLTGMMEVPALTADAQTLPPAAATPGSNTAQPQSSTSPPP
jgi:hypothetical protein